MSLWDAAYTVDPALWAEAVLGVHPDPWQADVLRSNSRRVLMNCSRQSGKTTSTAALALHTAIYRPGSLILCLSPTLRQSSELFHVVSGFYGKVAGDFPPQNESALRLELRNGSRIVSLPGQESTVRGYAGVTLLIVDEAARVKDDLYYSVRPMLAVSNGRMVALSTPWGARGWFYEAWVGPEDWLRIEVPAEKCPRISPEFLDEERRSMGSFWFEQEYCCKFLDAQNQAFRRADIDAMFGENVEAWSL